MENLIESIKNALASEASDETRLAGVQACRTILVALEAEAGQPMPVPVPPLAPTSSSLETIAAGLRGVPVDQLLDLAIAKLRTMVPAESVPKTSARFSIPLVTVPR